MDWETMRQQWRNDAPAAPALSVDELESRDQALQKQVWWRDLAETVAALVVAVFFAFLALGYAGKADWPAFGFALLLVAWALFVPLWMRRARRWMSVVEHHMPLVEGLARQRDAALAQARMLESVWLWYLAPPLVGLVGLTLAIDGLSTFTFVYLPIVALLCLGIGWLNRRVARTKFRAHAGQLQRQIDALNGEDGP